MDKCNVCNKELNNQENILTADCGGTCARCMIEEGDIHGGLSVAIKFRIAQLNPMGVDLTKGRRLELEKLLVTLKELE